MIEIIVNSALWLVAGLFLGVAIHAEWGAR
jgi:hypothetical protein